jgi:FkbM family methyltransferase
VSPTSFSSAKARRLLDVVHKGWAYLLALAAHPASMPGSLIAVSQGAHLGETLRLSEQRKWLERSGIPTVFDVGAHTGQVSSALRHFLPRAEIYAFEPLAECHEILLRRFAGDTSFHAFNTALGDTDGEVAFHTSSFPKASSPLAMTAVHKEAFPWSADTSVSQVPVRRLDTYAESLRLAANILLKVDVQGYENRVLAGAGEVLTKTSYVLVELSFAPLYEGQADFHDVYTFLTDRGFSYAGSWDQLASPLDGTILQTDALFVRAR